MGALIARLYTLDKVLVEKYDLHALADLQRLVAHKVGVDVPFNTPVTGAVAFHHKAGVHTKAVLNNPTTYEAINPADFGVSRTLDVAHRLVGWNAVRDRAATLGLALDEAALRAATARIKALADERRLTIADVDGVLHDAAPV